MNQNKNLAPNPKTPGQIVKDVAIAAEFRPQTCARRLDHESGRKTYFSNVMTEPLAKVERYSGNLEEGLTHVIKIGGEGTWLGIVRDINQKKLNSEDSSLYNTALESVRVVVLPLGEHANSRASAITLAEVRPASLRQTRTDGVVQDWESIKVGRKEIEQATGVNDPTVSRDHLRIRVDAAGGFMISDAGSANGTQILTVEDLNSYNGGLEGSGQDDFNSMVGILQESPYVWESRYADRPNVIDPDGGGF